MIWFALWSLIGAQAADVSEIDRGWYHLQRGSFERASDVASGLLTQNADDLGAHRLYLQARAKADPRGRTELVLLYRGWVQGEPNRVAAKWSLAAAELQLKGVASCASTASLVRVLPDDEASRYHALRIHLQWTSTCGGDKQEIQTALADLGTAKDPTARSYGAYHEALQGNWGAVAQQLDDIASYHPPRLTGLARLAFRGSGGAPTSVRNALVQHAKTLVKSSDPALANTGAVVLRTARDPGYDAAADHVQQLDPVEPHLIYRPIIELEAHMRSASNQTSDVGALAALDAMAGSIPPTGDVRLAWQRLRLERLMALGRGEEVFEAVANAAKAAPDNVEMVAWWAEEAAARGQQRQGALDALNQLLPTLQNQGYPGGQPVELWSREHSATLASWQSTRGWLRYGLGQYKPAVEALQTSVQLHPTGDGLARLGLALVKVDADALDALVAAQVLGVRNPNLAAQAMLALERRWSNEGIWHPGGLGGWLHDRKQADQVQRAHDIRVPQPGQHPLIGQALPTYTALRKVGGGSVTVGGEGDWRLVDVWATWCGTCTSRMARLDDIAAENRGTLTVVGLAADESRSAPSRFFKAEKTPSYDLAHVGVTVYDDLLLESLPVLFLVNPAGIIVDVVSEDGGLGDTRLHRVLQANLPQ